MYNCLTVCLSTSAVRSPSWCSRIHIGSLGRDKRIFCRCRSGVVLSGKGPLEPNRLLGFRKTNLDPLRLEGLCISLWGTRFVGTRLLITIEKIKSLNTRGVTRSCWLENDSIEVNLMPTNSKRSVNLLVGDQLVLSRRRWGTWDLWRRYEPFWVGFCDKLMNTVCLGFVWEKWTGKARNPGILVRSPDHHLLG